MKKIFFLYLLWFAGFVVSNVLWGVWVVLFFVFNSFSDSESKGRIILVRFSEEEGNSFYKGHFRWMLRSAVVFVLCLPVFFLLGVLVKPLVIVPYVWFFYRCLWGFVCFVRDKEPSGILSFLTKRIARKRRLNSSLVIISRR